MNIINKKFGRLTVIEKIRTDKNGHSYFNCKCECGNVSTTSRNSLVSGSTKSCGCLKKEQDRKNLGNKKHELSEHRLYWIRAGIIQRCYNENNNSFKNYGGRGIKLCNEWLDSVESFFKWAIDNGYDKRKTIDRIDNNGNYEPSNCRWVNTKTQSNNRRSNIKVSHDGEQLTLMQLSEATALDYKMLRMRYKRGDRGDDLIRPLNTLIKPSVGELNCNNKITEETARFIKLKLSKKVNCRELARELNISHHIVYDIKRKKTWNWL